MKKMTTKNNDSEAGKKEETKDVPDSVPNPLDKNVKNQGNNNVTTPYTKTTTLNPTALRPPPLQPSGFLRRLSFRDRRGSTPSPFLNSNVETIIPISAKYLKVPSSPPSSPTVPSNLG